MRLPAVSRLALAATFAFPAALSAQFASSSYAATELFENAMVTQHAFTMAKNAAGYWVGDGGGSGGARLFHYDLTGAFTASYAPGLDFRSIFSDASGNVFARNYADPTIYKMGAPGVFASYVTLAGGSLNAQSNVVLDAGGTRYIAMSGGTVSTWDASGTFLGSTSLIGFSGIEAFYPQSRGIVSVGGKWLTYNGLGDLSEWDPATGARLGTTTLLGAGVSFDGQFSLSYTGGKVWVADGSGPEYYWRGYDVGLSDVAAVPEPASITLIGIGLAGLGLVARKRQIAA